MALYLIRNRKKNRNLFFVPNIKQFTTSLLLCPILMAGASAQTDTSYIGQYEKNFAISGYVYHNFYQLARVTDDSEVDYLPNKPLGGGIGFSHKKLPFDINLGYYLGVKEDDNYLRTKGVDFQIRHYARMYVTDLVVQRYKGLYIDDNDLPINEANCPDISVFQTSLAGQYVFNGRKFSYKAAFNQTEKQLKSVGSLLIGADIYYCAIESDSSFTYREKNNLKSYQLGLNVGYAYNWVPRKHWLISGSISVGAGFGNECLSSFFDKNFSLTPTTLCRSSIFYNKENWSLGMFFVFNTRALKYSENSEIDINSGRVYIKYIHRLDLKKNK